jgi:recombination protein RecT
MAADPKLERQGKMIALIEARTDDFAKALPPQLPSTKFVRVIKTAIAQTPALAEVDPKKLIIECQKCAADGLVADGREAVIVVYNVKKKEKVNGVWQERWEKEPKYQPMYQGMIKRARNTGELRTINAYIVYANELKVDKTLDPPRVRFRRWIDDAGEHIHHEPLATARGAIVGAYSVAQLRGGIFDRCYMPIEDLRKIQARSRSKDKDGNATGPWKTDEEEMMKKTVIKRHGKTLPMDSDLARVFSRDDDLYEHELPQARDVTPIAGKARGGAAAVLNDDSDEDHDPETGVVIDDEPERKSEPKKTARKPAAQAKKSEPETGEDDDAYDGDVM